LTAFR